MNQLLLNALPPDEVDVVIQRVEDAEVDEMWSYVGKKHEQRWLWHAIDHQTGKVLAYVCGRRQDQVFLRLKALLEPFGIKRYRTDYWGAYTRHLDPTEHNPGKRNTQQIERKHLTLRTRIKRLTRKTICFSRSIRMHDIVIGLWLLLDSRVVDVPMAYDPTFVTLSSVKLFFFNGLYNEGRFSDHVGAEDPGIQ